MRRYLLGLVLLPAMLAMLPAAVPAGELKIRELRARAEKTLGPSFDLRAFHDAILELGSVPLPLLEQRIDQFIAERAPR